MDIPINKNTVVVFDLDDTLYNELDFLISAYKEISFSLEKSNSKELFSIMLSLYRNNKNVFNYLIDNYETSKKDLLSIYINHKPKIELHSGALEIIKNIRKKNGKIAIITDGRSITQRNKINSLKISKLIDFLSISEEINHTKPSLEPFLMVESHFKLNNYYYIADNHKKDFITPNKLKWNTVEIIDNGKNIHSNSCSFIDSIFRAKQLVFDLKEINII
jgi:putative hydrolase of the HAD superfamily